MGPGDQLARRFDDDAPDAVGVEAVEGQVGQAAVFGGADEVFAAGSAAMS